MSIFYRKFVARMKAGTENRQQTTDNKQQTTDNGPGWQGQAVIGDKP